MYVCICILVYLLLISKYAQKAVARDPTTKLSKNSVVTRSLCAKLNPLRRRARYSKPPEGATVAPDYRNESLYIVNPFLLWAEALMMLMVTW